MRSYTLAAFLLCFFIKGYAQFNYLDTVYKLNAYNAEYSYSSVRLSENKLALVGYGVNTHYEINIFCINLSGDTLWNQQYNTDSLGVPGVIRSTLDAQKNILVAGYVNINNSVETRALLLKVDSMGNLKWLHAYKSDSTDFTEYKGLLGDVPVATYSNQYLLICQNGRDPDIANIMAIVTDTMGNEITRWRYVNPFYEYPAFAIQTSDSGFLFGGYSDRLDPDTEPYFWTMYIMKVNRYGTPLWDTSIEALSTGSYLYTGDAMAEDAKEVADGYIISGERCDRSNFTYPEDERGWAKCWYGKFDKNDGHLLWDHYLGPDTLDFAWFYGITPTQDGGYALCGIYNYQNNTRQKGFVAKTDSNGDTLWTYTITRHIDSIYDTEQMELHDMYEIEGGYLVTGFRIPEWPIDGNPFPYVLTIDTNGCPTYDCHNSTNISDTAAVRTISLLIYPNPMYDMASFKYSFYENSPENYLVITDILGDKISHLSLNYISGIVTLNMSELAAGIYFCSLVQENHLVAVQKFVKE